MKLKLLVILLFLFNIIRAQTVTDIITGSPDHNVLEAALVASGLDQTLNGPGPFTVFAPTDDAFAALPAGTIEALLADPQGLLTDILLYHVVGATALSTDLSDGQQIVNLNGASVTVTINADGVFINDAQVTVADLVADNGVVHVINAVLLPPAPVTTVMDIIENSADHTILEAAINAAGLNGTLDGAGPFTVFAPTDAAFAALPAGTIEALLADPQGLLTDILLYHVVGATALSTDLSDGQQIVTLNGASVTVTINADGVFINDAQVTVADLVADNGVVHVINAVLLPPAPPVTTVMDIIENSADHTILEAAINAAGLNGTLDGTGPFTVFAPTDAAFAALPAGTIEALLADPQGLLTDILLYHVVGATALSTDLSDGQQIVTLNGASVTVTINADGVFINDAQVTVADLVADNGVVHVINAVLLPPAPVTTVMDIIENSADHTILEAAINAAGLNGTLDGTGPFTVFAPTDAAFAALPAGTIEALLADPQGLLTDILLYHVVGATALSTDLSDGQQIVTLNGASVTVTINADGVFINDAQVTVADLVADNGVVHVINAVLLPPAPVTTVMDIIENSADHTILEAAINAAGLNGTLDGAGPFTVFAPTDAAFAALPAGTIEALLADPQGLLTDILLYHVLGATALSTDLSDGQQIVTLNGASVTVTINADGVFINDAQVTVADLVADNGVVHVINAVLLPPAPPVTTVMDIIENSADHTILEAAINAAGLNGTLDGTGPFTVFAPTDAAFAALPAGTIEALLADPQGLLTDILLYHVVGATALSTDLSDGQQIVTLNGASVTVTINADGVFINDAQVTVADLVADNGVVHVINAVLLPPAPPVTTVMDIIENSADHTILEAAINAAGLNGTLDGTGPFTVFAPTDAAFAALPAGTIEALLADPQGLLTDILLYHVVGATALSTDLSDGQQIVTLNGASVTVTINADGVFINDAQVTVADLVADNGVVHVINAVLLPPAPVTTVMDIIENSADHTILEAAINAAGLNGTLDGAGPFTVFAPNDNAFEGLPDGTIEALLADPQGLLTEILLYHVVGATALSSDLSNGQVITTLNGESVTVTINANGVFINTSKVIIADIIADNGVVHVIKKVLLPPVPTTVMDIIADNDNLTTLEAAIVAAELDGTLSGNGPFTVFAPTDAAFAALPAGTIEALLADPQGLLTDILLYHVVGVTALSSDLSNGQVITTLNGATVTVTINANGVFINNAKVKVADLIADNGVVHVINAVLLPPVPPVPTTVMDIIAERSDLTILEAAVLAAGLDVALNGDGPFTVFAPKDAAFEALPAGTIEALLADPTGLLTDILLYHAVGATALSSDLSNGQSITTLQGENVIVTINANGIFINNAKVTIADIEADNGVVHIINAVLLPPTVGIENVEINSNKFQVYPNPSTDFVYIQNLDNVQVDRIILFDGLGRNVKEWTTSNTYEQLDVTSFSSGFYNIVIYSEAAVLTYPLVIQQN